MPSTHILSDPLPDRTDSPFPVFRAVTCLLLVIGSGSFATAQPFPAPGRPIPGQFPDMRVQQTQHFGVSNGADEFKPLPREIIAMPDIEQEMEVIQRRSQLVITRNQINRMAIADPNVIDIVQYSPTEISIIGVGRGSTTLTLWFEGNPDPLIYLIRVIRDPSLDDQRRIDYGNLERRIALLFPDSKVYLIPLSRKLIVKGQARDAEEAARILQLVRGEAVNMYGDINGPQPGLAGLGLGLGGGGGLGFGAGNLGAGDQFAGFIVNMLEVPGEHQVMLRVRIAELSRSQLRNMGVDISYLLNSGRHLLESTLGGAGGTLTGVFEAGEIAVLVNWLATNGSVKILAEPTVTVLSGHPASFLSGGEFAVPTVVGVGGAAGTSTTFRGFGTSLLVTPSVIDRDLIRMNIIPEYSSIDLTNAVGGVPGLNTNRVQTTVQLREGQTLVLAGLFARTQGTEIARIPYLSKIPKIGPTLFSTKRASEDETELLVLVTPEIVRPMDADEVPPLPGFAVTHPTDEQLYWHAMIEGPPDRGVYQLAPYGAGTGRGIDVGYRLHNPAPASAMVPPAASGGYGGTGMPGPAMSQPTMSAPMGGHYSPTYPSMPVETPYHSMPSQGGPVYQGQPYSAQPYSGGSTSPSYPMPQSRPMPQSHPTPMPHGSAPRMAPPSESMPVPAPGVMTGPQTRSGSTGGRYGNPNRYGTSGRPVSYNGRRRN